MDAMWLLQAQSQAEPHTDSDSGKEGLLGADEPSPPKKKGLFKRGWGSGHKGTAKKQVKPSKSKLNEGSAALAQKSAGKLAARCKILASIGLCHHGLTQLRQREETECSSACCVEKVKVQKTDLALIAVWHA